MTSRPQAAAQKKWWTQNSRWWLLSALLGLLTLLSMIGIIHDRTAQRAAGRLAARAAAEQAVASATGRLKLVALGSFAPVTEWVGHAPLPSRSAVSALVMGQRHGERCLCRLTVPATEFFRLVLGSGAIDVESLTPVGGGGALTSALLSELAKGEAGRSAATGQSQIQLLVDPRLGSQLLIMVTQRDDGGTAIAVDGLVADARATAAILFVPEPTRSSPVDSRYGLPALDSASLEVFDAQGESLYGHLGPNRPSVARVLPVGPLEGLVVKVALSPHDVNAPPVVGPQALWHLGMLLVCTILAVAVAVGSSRREVLLAHARSDFIAGVSHDLRMPLAQILLAGESLGLPARRKAAERRTLVHTIVRESRRLMSLVDNVLLYSRSGSVELRATLLPISVAQLFADVVESVQLAAADARQEIVVDAGEGLGVLGDPQLVRQALVNYLDNALKYGKAGQLVQLRAEQSGFGLVRLVVEDDGPGIPAEARARLFEPYERLERDQSSERTGSGLGLAVVRDIARACRGRVWLEESPSGGTRALFELRASPLPNDATAAEGS